MSGIFTLGISVKLLSILEEADCNFNLFMRSLRILKWTELGANLLIDSCFQAKILLLQIAVPAYYRPLKTKSCGFNVSIAHCVWITYNLHYFFLQVIFWRQTKTNSSLHYSASSASRSLSHSLRPCKNFFFLFFLFFCKNFSLRFFFPLSENYSCGNFSFPSIQPSSRPSERRTSAPPPAIHWMASPFPSSAGARLGTREPAAAATTRQTPVNVHVGVGAGADHWFCETDGGKLWQYQYWRQRRGRICCSSCSRKTKKEKEQMCLKPELEKQCGHTLLVHY